MFFIMFSYVFIMWLLWSWCFVNALWRFVDVSFKFHNKSPVVRMITAFFHALDLHSCTWWFCPGNNRASVWCASIEKPSPQTNGPEFFSLKHFFRDPQQQTPTISGDHFSSSSSSSEVPTRWRMGRMGRMGLPWMGWKICHQGIHELHFFTAFRWGFLRVFPPRFQLQFLEVFCTYTCPMQYGLYSI